jgi:signal peptidase I
MRIRCALMQRARNAGYDGSPGWPRQRRERGSVALWILVVLIIGGAFAAYSSFELAAVSDDEMAPTLRRGDVVLLCKACRKPERGDIVLLAAPEEAGVAEGSPLYRRVLALPGDTVTVQAGEVLINGRILKGKDAGVVTLRRDIDQIKAAPAPVLMAIETTGKHRYRVAREQRIKPTGDRAEEKLERGYFVLADQRTWVKDSRDFGPVGSHRIRGTVLRIVDVTNDEPERLGPLP